MPENRNVPLGFSPDGRGTVCIDTHRVLDCCRDRDCFEDTRVYLTDFGEQTLASATSVRTRSAELLWAYVGVDEVPFNRGFYQVTVRYYILVECEACLGIGRSQNFTGIAVVEKDVILYGGEGQTVSFSSAPQNNYCNICNFNTRAPNDPIAYVETVEPVVLNTKVVEPGCCKCPVNETAEIPENIRARVNGDLRFITDGPRLYISFGVFSVIKIVRPAQLLVQATDYSVPDKECVPAGSDDNPCALFKNMAFPVNQFRATVGQPPEPPRRPGCGCGGRDDGPRRD